MGYLLKEKVADDLRKKYKNGYIADQLGLSQTYVSLIFHRKRNIPQRLAFAFAKAISPNLKINDLFEITKK